MKLFDDETPTGPDLEPFRSVPALADSQNRGADTPTFTESAIRNHLARRDENGLSQFVRKVGNKVLISEPGWNFWLRQQGQHPQRELDLQGGGTNGR